MLPEEQAKYSTPLTPLTLEELQNLEKMQKKFEKVKPFYYILMYLISIY